MGVRCTSPTCPIKREFWQFMGNPFQSVIGTGFEERIARSDARGEQ